MDSLAGEFLARLPGAGVERLLNFLDGHMTTYSTLCAGTDSPVLAIDVWRDSLLSRNCLSTFAHSFSCEKHPGKRSFLRRMFPSMQRLFRDVDHLAGDVAFDEVSNSRVRIPQVEGAIGGFPCQDASQLNVSSRSDDNRSCVEAGSHRTGFVFDRMIRHLQKNGQRLQWVVLRKY